MVIVRILLASLPLARGLALAICEAQCIAFHSDKLHAAAIQPHRSDTAGDTHGVALLFTPANLEVARQLLRGGSFRKGPLAVLLGEGKYRTRPSKGLAPACRTGEDRETSLGMTHGFSAE